MIMRPVTRRIRVELFVSLGLVLFGCGTTSAPAKPIVAKKPDRDHSAEKRYKQQAELVSELEIRIAMLESAVRELRADVKRRDQASRTETIRIGRSSKPSTDSESLVEESEQNHDRGLRPVLRLYGESRPIGREEPLVLPEPPPSVPTRLSVVPVAKRGAVTRAVEENNQPDEPDNRLGVAEYRTALGFVRQRKYEQALQALSDFIESHPKSAYVDSAFYWRGEVYYAKRAYRDALEQFEVVTTRFPSSRKMPDSLLKTGMCHKRLGDVERARALFSRLRRQYPTSDAARIASLESS